MVKVESELVADKIKVKTVTLKRRREEVATGTNERKKDTHS